MKLIMESWNRFLNEEEGADLKEFYHATDWPVKDFIKGIDPRAEGYGQGKGFYVFSKKEDALEHAATLADVEWQRTCIVHGCKIVCRRTPRQVPGF